MSAAESDARTVGGPTISDAIERAAHSSDAAGARERWLAWFTGRNGTICALALDHRDAMRNAYRQLGVIDVTERTMLAAKARIISGLAGRASAILLDSRAVRLPRPAELGVFMPLEVQGHESRAGGRLNRLLDDFGPRDALAAGADGCKLLLYYRADHLETSLPQLELAAQAAEASHEVGLPLVVEPKVYRLGDEDEVSFQWRFGELVVAAARDLSQSGADLLKLQYPGDRRLCERVSEAAAPLHWTLLGGEVDDATFAFQLRDACRAGACGFIAGRAIWGKALALEPGAQAEWLERYGEPLFERLCNITETYARRIV